MHDPSVEERLQHLSRELSDLQERLDALRTDITELRIQLRRTPLQAPGSPFPLAESIQEEEVVSEVGSLEVPPILPAVPERDWSETPEAAPAPPTKQTDYPELFERLNRPRGRAGGGYGSPPAGNHGVFERETAELVFGRTWLNRIGAVILFLGVAFFIKYSFDQGWISPTMRVLLAAGAGLALLAAGEVLLRRNMRPVAAGVLGAGIGTLYASAFGAYNFYHLVNPSVAFVLYCLVTAASVFVALHANLLPLAVLAVIGGFGTPILLSTGSNQQIALLTYVLLLDLAFLVIAEVRRWEVLRPLAWLGTALLFCGWALKFYHVDDMWRTWFFLTCFYVMFHASAVLSIRRRSSRSEQLLAAIVHAGNAVFFLSTYLLWHKVIPDWLGLFAVALAAIQWVLAWRVVPRTVEARPLGLGLWLGGAAMLALAAPLQFDRYLVTVSWCVQAIFTFAFCRRFPERWLRLKGLAVWNAAIAHLFMFERVDRELTVAFWQLGGFHTSWTIVLYLFASVSGFAAAASLMVRREADLDDRSLAVVLGAGGTILIMWTAAYHWERYVASWWWIGLGAAWSAVALRAAPARWIALAVTCACAAKFAGWDTVEATAGFWSQIEGLVLNRAVLTGISMLLLVYFTRQVFVRLKRDKSQAVEGWPVADALSWTALVLVTWTGTFEIFRAFEFEKKLRSLFAHPEIAQSTTITVFWAANAVALWIITRPKWRNLVYYALLLTVFVLVKYCIIDTLGLAVTGNLGKVSGVIINAPFLAGLAAVAATGIAHVRLKRLVREPALRLPIPLVEGTVLALALLAMWIPTFEIARVFRYEPLRLRFADPALAMHLALSVLWSVNATIFLLIGFARRVPALRHAALGVYGVTIVKVFIYDMSNLETIYRIVSFVVLGVLLLFASVLYQKLALRMAAEQTKLE